MSDETGLAGPIKEIRRSLKILIAGLESTQSLVDTLDREVSKLKKQVDALKEEFE